MGQNHLIIGLGGTGGKIIRAFKKTVLQEFRTEKPDKVNIEYLYVDSSAEMMALDDPSWKTLGKSVQLGKHQQLLIQGANLSAQLESINNFPGIKPWIGSKDQWQDILNSIVGEVLGGQKRRLGRFLFACKVRDFRQQIQNLVRDLQQKGSTSITFHICFGLAGGTGSGSIIDTIAQLREMYPDSRIHRIVAYALLPDTQPRPNWDTGNYHANGYAGLLELNSLSVGTWQPHDVLGNKDRLKLQDPFNGCFLFLNENDNGLSVDVNEDVPSIVADFLFQKIVAVDDLSWATLRRMENAENGDGSPECTPGSTQGERSKRFLTFGIKRLVVPEEEIREYMTYNFARQTTMQMLFNNWSDSIGFLDEAKNSSFREFVSQKETLHSWSITDEHLCLSVGILPDEIGNKKWKPINIDWQEFIPNLKEVVRQQDSKTWLTELAIKCEERFEQTYRGMGVRKFYEIKTATRKDHAREIRNRIEGQIFEEWKNGSRSAHEIGQLLDSLLIALETRTKDMEERAVRANESAEIAVKKISANSKTWAAMGIISATVFGKKNNLFDAQSSCLEEFYVHRTRSAGWQFAKDLIPQLISELSSLRGEVTKFSSLVTETVKNCDDRIAERCNDAGEADLRRPLVQFYNPNGVRQFTRQLTNDRRVQHAQANDVRLAIVEQLGENPDFTILNARMPKQRLIDILESRCAEGAVNAHNNLIASDKDKVRQLGVNIIEKLYKEFGSNQEGLRKYISDLVSRAGNYIIFDPLEANKIGPGIKPPEGSKISQFTVILPKAPEWAEFLTNLKEIFRSSLTMNMEFIESDAKPNEIVLISLTNLFPLRFVKQLAFLKERYDGRIQSPESGRNKLELHCEGDGLQHPRLYVPSGEDLRQESLPYLILSKALRIVKKQESPTTGKSELVLLTKNADDLDNPPLKLGQTLLESVEKINAENIEVIRREVQKVLTQDYCHVEKQAELKKGIVHEVNEVKAERKGDMDDPIYMRFLEAGKRAMKIVAQEG